MESCNADGLSHCPVSSPPKDELISTTQIAIVHAVRGKYQYLRVVDCFPTDLTSDNVPTCRALTLSSLPFRGHRLKQDWPYRLQFAGAGTSLAVIKIFGTGKGSGSSTTVVFYTECNTTRK